MLNNKTILVTGAAGFIGYWLSKKLLEKGYAVIGLDNLNDYYDVNLKHSRLEQLGIIKEDIIYNSLIKSSIFPKFSFIKLNLEDAEGLNELIKNTYVNKICHLGAQAGVRYSIENPMSYVNSNIVGFTTILELCRHNKISHLVYASSSSVYGLNTKMPFSPHDPTNHPVSFYAATKKANELMAHVYSQLYDLPTTGLRFFTVYGPWGRPDMSPMLFADAIMKNKTIKVFNNGNMGRDFTYIEDVVEGIIKVINFPPQSNELWHAKNPDPASSSAKYRIYNIGNSSPVNLIDYIETMENAFGKKVNKEYLPMQPGDVLNTFSDVSDLEKDFNFKPKTSLKEGISKFTEWYMSYYK